VASVELRWSPQVASVVSVWNDVALVGAVVLALGESVGDAEEEASGIAEVPGYLKRVVS